MAMVVSEQLKLVGLDEADLAVISAHMQDAVIRVGDLDFSPGRRQFVIAANRFVWEDALEKRKKSFERRRAVLHFDCVTAARTLGIDRRRPDDVLSLLALEYEPGVAAPAGEIELILAGDASIVLSVECIEVQLSDQGGAWETSFRPKHPLSD